MNTHTPVLLIVVAAALVTKTGYHIAKQINDCIVAIATATVYVTSVLNLNDLDLVSLVQPVPYIIGASMTYDNHIHLSGK